MRVTFISNSFRPHLREVFHVEHKGGAIALLDRLPKWHGLRADDAAVWRNGVQIDARGDRLEIDAAAEDEVVVVRVAGVAAGSVILGVTIGKFAAVLINLAIAYAAGLILGRILAPPSRTRDEAPQDGPAYGFAGIRSRRTEGRPREVIYGRIRAGGTLISEVIDNTHSSAGNASYRAQLAFGEGPIHAIAGVTSDTLDGQTLESGKPGLEVPPGIELDGNAASNVEHVEAVIRLGSSEQAHALGFDVSEARVISGTVLNAPVSSDLNPATPLITTGQTNQADQDALFGQYGVTVDLPDDADLLRVTVRFPSGYFLTFGGTVAGRSWGAVIRYIRLDAGGLPITTGGDFGDGYVRVQMPTVGLKSTSAFSIDYTLAPFDPVGYVPQSNGYSYGGLGSPFLSMMERQNPSLPAGFTHLSTHPDVTASIWVLPIGFVGSSNSIFGHYYWDGITSVPTVGMELVVKTITYTTSPGSTLDALVPVLLVYSTIALPHEIYEGVGQPYYTPSVTIDGSGSELTHLAYSYADDIGTGDSRVRLYANGELIEEQVGTTYKAFAPSLNPGARIRVMDETYGAADECWYYNEERQIADIYRDFNHGLGRTGTTSGSGEDFTYLEPSKLIGGWHFDDNLGTGTLAVSFGTIFGNDLLLSGSSNTQSQWLVPGASQQNDHLSHRYRVEVLRNVADSTDPESFDDDVELESVSGLVDTKFSCPGTPHLSIAVDAQEQLGTNVPGITSIVSGRLVPHWDGSSIAQPAFYEKWSRNVAACVLDRILNVRYGFGQYFKPKHIDAVSWQEFHDYCHELIYDLRGQEVNGNNVDASGFRLMYYESSTSGEPQFDDRGRISFQMDDPAPSFWIPGNFLGWSGVYTEGAPDVDSNEDANGIGGYEIERVFHNGTNWEVWLYWDRLDEGDPWGDGGYLEARPGFPGHGQYDGQMRGKMRRHTYDAVHDTAEPSWESIQQMAAIGRGSVVLDGNTVRFRVNKPRTPVGILSMGNIVKDSFEVAYGGPSQRANAYTIEFLDEDANWKRKPAYVEHPSVQNAGDEDDLRHASIFVRGITRRAAALRHGHFVLNVNQQLERVVQFRAAVDSIHYEVGDVLVLQHDVVQWGQGGRAKSDSANDASLVIDVDIVLDAATTYYADVRDPETNGFETVQVSTVAGTYLRGTTITLASSLSFTPAQGTVWVIWHAGDRKLVEVTGMGLNPKDMTVQVDAVEYDETVYAEISEDMEVAVADLGNSAVGESFDDRIPDQPRVRGARSRVVLGDGGEDVVRIEAGWEVPRDATDRAQTMALWTKRVDLTDTWEKRAEVPASQGTATIELVGARVGDQYALAFQVISARGKKRTPAMCASRRLTVGWAGFRPDPPQAFSATLRGANAVYSLTPARNAAGCFHEIRRGGWILGQVVAVLPPGETTYGPTADWADGATNSEGRSSPTLHCRAMTPSGRYSTEATELTQAFAPDFGMDIREAAPSSDEFFPDQSWEDFGTGWAASSGTIDTTLTDLVAADGIAGDPQVGRMLTFTGSALTGYFETAEETGVKTLGQTWVAQSYHIELFAEAYQVHPTSFASDTGRIESVELGAMTAEGPIDLGPNATGNCTLRLEIATKLRYEDIWSAWADFRPGVYYGVLFKFRIVVTRPDATYDVRITRAHQRIRRVSPEKWERSPAEFLLMEGV